jgi:superfamily II DNA or RNA helicase
MACGTGKTLVTLWTAEQLGSKKILVLLPSLALLRQTLHEWLKETSLDPLAYLCVCSDPSVKGDADAISTAQSDLDFEVSTDSTTVRRFLDAPFNGTKIVFSTYQSASVVGEALKTGESFDLGIFDEAHKMAGREGRNYGYALEDRNIPITKRLFVTATPRHYNPSKQTKEGEASLAFSMDDPKLYGEQAYVLTFSKAAELGIICGYKVIISVITSDQVNDEVLSKGLVRVEGDEVVARQVANQIALRDAVAQYGVGKVFTFHSTVKSAASFVADGNEGVLTHLPEFEAYHVSGAMPTAHRERLLTDFKRSERALMSNARCLTEGVDVPAVDMVAFLSPKKSKVDIVQAIGRAMRKSKGKETGYVLIPLYLEQKAGESLEEAVARTNFEEVWDILQSLKEQDEVLADLIRDMAEAKGRGKGEKENPLAERIDFVGPVLSLETLRDSITARTLERLESSWDVNLGKLVKFKEEHGHCRVPLSFKEDPTLARWVGSQRIFYSKGKLSLDRIARLKNLDFEWDPYASDWEFNFSKLQTFKTENSHCRVSYGYAADIQLSRWVATQRRFYSKGKLSSDRIARLEALGFQWGVPYLDWDQSYSKLEDFKNKYGHCRVSQSYKIDDFPLGWWVTSQRRACHNKNRKKLSPDRIMRLESLGFEWDPFASDWELNFAKLQEFKAANGHCRIFKSFKDDPSLGLWVGTQRRFYSNGRLSQDRIARLEAIGFEWDPYASDWELNFSKLEVFKKTTGHCRVPWQYKADVQLGRWVQVQRRGFSKRKLSQDRIARLEAIGFEWKIKF